MDAVGINWPGLLTQLISFLILFLLLKNVVFMLWKGLCPKAKAKVDFGKIKKER